MKDIIKNFLETSNERIKNPFIGAFILAWIACNWRPISVFIFSNYRIEARIDIIEKKYSDIFLNLYIPILIALIYIIVLPYIMWLIDEILQKSNSGRKRNLVFQQIEDYRGKQKLAVEESKLEDIKANYRDKADLNHQIEILREQIDQRDKQLSDYKKEIKILTESNLEFKKLIAESQSEQLSNVQIEKFENAYSKFHNSDLFRHFYDIGRSIRKSNEIPHFIDDIIREKVSF